MAALNTALVAFVSRTAAQAIYVRCRGRTPYRQTDRSGCNVYGRSVKSWRDPGQANRCLGQSNAEKRLFDRPGLSTYWRNDNQTLGWRTATLLSSATRPGTSVMLAHALRVSCQTNAPTAVLPKIPHCNSSKSVPNRPPWGRRGRFGTLLQQLECGIFGRTAVRYSPFRQLFPSAPTEVIL